VAIHYQSGSDPVYTANPADNDARLDYYGISAFPTMMMDGLYDCWPLTTLQGYFDTRMLVPCHLGIGVQALDGSTETSGTIRFTLATDIGMDTEATIHSFINESGIPGTGTFSGSFFNYALRKNLFGPDGDAVTFGTSPETLVIDVDYTIDATWDWDQLYLTSFVQSNATDEVQNSHMIKFSDLIASGTGEGAPGLQPLLSLGPNPSSGSITVTSSVPGQTGDVQVFSMSGRLVALLPGGNGSVRIDESGVYLARLVTRDGVAATRTVVVIR
jgi:hypothetical protein